MQQKNKPLSRDGHVVSRFRLLQELADAARDSTGSDDTWLATPDWSVLCQQGKLTANEALRLRQLETTTPLDRCEDVEKDLLVTCVRLIQLPYDDYPLQVGYCIYFLWESVRVDLTCYEVMRTSIGKEERLSIFENLLKAYPNEDVADRVAFLASGLMSRPPWDYYDFEQVIKFAKDCLGDGLKAKYNLSTFCHLEILGNLLKHDINRKPLWSLPYTVELLSKSLKGGCEGNPLMQYKGLFCLWLLSYQKTLVPDLAAAGLVEGLCHVIIESRVEKIVRVCQLALRNMLDRKESLDIVLEANLRPVLALLEYDKWRDPDVYDEIRLSIVRLDEKIKSYSTFEQYRQELRSGRLKWGIVHGEKFWKDNFMDFEDNEFEAIKMLGKLLSSDHATTSSVACYDLGEFARLHPAGKKICQKYKIKEKVLPLVTSKEREVAKQALLCIQKLFLNHWKEAAETTDPFGLDPNIHSVT